MRTDTWRNSENAEFLRVSVRMCFTEARVLKNGFYSFSSVFYWYLVHAPLVASAFKAGGEELRQDAVCFFVGDEAAWHDEHVGVVVLAG